MTYEQWIHYKTDAGLRNVLDRLEGRPHVRSDDPDFLGVHREHCAAAVERGETILEENRRAYGL